MILLWKMVGWVMSPVGRVLAIAVPILAFIGSVYMKGRSEGAGKEKAKQADQTIKRMETRNEVEDNISRADDSSVRKRLQGWARD